jgi:hypothetical protein
MMILLNLCIKSHAKIVKWIINLWSLETQGAWMLDCPKSSVIFFGNMNISLLHGYTTVPDLFKLVLYSLMTAKGTSEWPFLPRPENSLPLEIKPGTLGVLLRHLNR